MSDTRLRKRRAASAAGLDSQEALTAGKPNSTTGILPKRAITKSLLLLLSLCVPLALTALYSTQQTNDPLDYKSRTENILKTTPLIDGHNDLPYLLRLELKNKIYDTDKFTFRTGVESHTDLKRIIEGKVGGQFWSVFVECPNITGLEDPNNSVRDTLEQIDVAKRLFDEYPELHYCETSVCAVKAFKSGHIASMLGAEGLHQAGSAIGVIRQLYELGVRYITITHNCDNPFATAASTVTATGKDGGLTAFGEAAIEEMNRLGMMVDMSHVSHRTMHDILDITQAPVIFSHGGCYELAKNYRNAPDSVLARLKENGGVFMVYFVDRLLALEHPESADIDTVLNHIFHIVEIAGWDHVGIGADYDGTPSLVQGLGDVASYPRLIEAVMRRGATDEQVRKLIGENILRVWRENEVISDRIHARGKKPVEEVWEGRIWTRWNNPLPVMFTGNKDRITAKDFL